MVRDFLGGQAILMVALAGLALLVVRNLQVVGPSGNADLAACFVTLDWTTMALTLVATAGLVSGDFAQGHQRTLFAKPVNPALYYLQRWLIGGVAVAVAALPVAYAIGSRFAISLIGPSFFARLILLYLVLGGVVFLLSTVTRRDWLLTIILVAWQAALSVAHSSGVAHGPLAKVLIAILPPFQLIGLRGPTPESVNLAYAVGYGALVLGAALAMLQWRPLARGARD
jgi:ABC-type transport system involved in multi-copper enzyme maturation permease subunit